MISNKCLDLSGIICGIEKVGNSKYWLSEIHVY